MTVYLNIGSNRGDRRALIGQAVALIASAFPDARMRLSDFIESEPWGFTSAHRFLNLGVALDCPVDIDPETVLDTTQRIERTVCADAHRNADGSYRDRGIDIDIIAVDTLVFYSTRLQVPHPRAAQRSFVMTPLLQLAPPSVIAHVTRLTSKNH